MSEPGDLVEYLLRIGDDALIASQRLAEWCAHAPELEEDIALANIALDQLGVARAALTHAGAVEGRGRDEDALAYLRDAREFRNCLLVELPNGADGTHDFAVTIAKLLVLSAYQKSLYDALATSTDATVAGIAAKARLESAYHLDHSAQWTIRLGDGTEESHRRMRDALDAVWPYTHELFDDDEVSGRLAAAGVGVAPRVRPMWTKLVEEVLAEAMLTVPAQDWGPTGGRAGRHTEHLAALLGEAQSVHRAHPGARW